MVNNFVNINKTNNHLASELSSLNKKKTTTHDFGNPGPGLGQAQKCGGVKPVNEIPTLSSWYLISNDNNVYTVEPV